MFIKEIFQKDINREIDGVIKANDFKNIDIEVDEYVITQEIEEKLDTFFDAYAATIGNPTKDIGVWISGFFGSGKSHLLKLLSVILGEEKKYKEIFLQKLLTCDTFLQANAKKALFSPAQTILFNIDQQSNIVQGSSSNSVLSVFQRVFDDMRGYFGEKPYIAQFEKFLDEEGLYDEFREIFKQEAGDSWENKRHQVLIRRKEFAKALSSVLKISEDEAKNKLKEFQDEFDLTPLKFAKEVKQYIQTKESNFRLIFLVDEIGQFIAEDVNKMLNLQTIVESLAEACNGQAWVVVTSQQDIESITGDINAQQQHDFARIMGRFKTKLNLTSANADEVIRRRILAKNEKAVKILEEIFFEQQANLKSLFYFTEGMQFKQIQNKEDFESNYPFLPYQFDLLGMVLLELSRHNAMLGRAQSVGERSMLELFQKTAQLMQNKEVGVLSDFGNFYEALQSILKTEVINAINLSKNNPKLDDFDHKVLKTLFLVRYVESFKSNKENIATLLIQDLLEDKLVLEKRVQESLNKLENQTFIQRNGEFYFYLTNEEKDILEEIKNIVVDTNAINDHIANVVFDGVIGVNKITHDKYEQDYFFTKKLDDIVKSSREYEIGINIITPYYYQQEPTELLNKSMGSRDLIVKLPNDDLLKKEIRLFLQTQLYYKQYASDTSKSQSYKRILNEQLQENSNRKRNIAKKIESLLQNSLFIANGRELTPKGGDAKIKIITAFNEAIDEFYPQRKILREKYSQNEIVKILYASDDLLADSKNNLTEAGQQLYNKIQLAKKQNEIQTLKTLLDAYTSAPYGWDRWTIVGLIVLLWQKDLIEVKLNGDTLEQKDLEIELNNTHSYANLVILPATVVDTRCIKVAKEVYNELFSKSLGGVEQKEIYRQFQTELKSLVEEMERIFAKLHYYPFVAVLEKPLEFYRKILQYAQSDFFEYVCKNEEIIEDYYEDIISPLKQFMAQNGQVNIYDSIKEFYVKEGANLSYVQATKKDLEELNSFLHSQKPYNGGLAKRANEAFKRVKAEINEILQKERQTLLEMIESYIEKFQNNEEFHKYLTPEQKLRVQKPFLELKNSVNDIFIIDTLKNQINNLSALYAKQNDLADDMIYETKVANGEIEIPKPKPTITFMALHREKFSGRVLETKEDVQSYIDELTKELLKAVEEDKKVSL